MTKDKALMMALEALQNAENSLGSFVSDHGWSQSDMDIMDNTTATIIAIKAALAQPAQPEQRQPVQAANEPAPLEHVATVAVTEMRVDIGWLKAVPHNTKLFAALPLPPTQGRNK